MQVDDTELFQELIAIRHKWFTIGLQLQFSESELLKLNETQSNVKNRLRKLCSMWTEREQEEATWEMVVAVLRHLEELVLADSLEEKYGVLSRTQVSLFVIIIYVL